MDRFHEGDSGIGRRTSTRLSMQHHDDEEDDYDLEAMGISDGYSGYRPGGMGGPAMGSSSTSENRASQASQQYTPAGRRTPPPRPSSTTKPRGLDSFALRHDGGMGSITRHSTVASNRQSTYAPSRRSSVSTEMSFVPRPESSYRGPTAPSHQYQVYSNEGRLARTASVATTVTSHVPEHPYNGPGGPTHPYGMYPQNISEAEIEDPIVPVPIVPVGFPGSSDNYQRRLGPEGEEIAGLIGPDGHTEELPPYTKYPDEAFARKTRENVVAVPAVIPGAGGIGLATRNPEFESQEDSRSVSPQSLRSTPSIMSERSEHQVNVAAMGASEKPQLKKWQQIARRKLCNVIPIWVLVLIALISVLFGIILGTVLAVLKPKHNSTDKAHHSSVGNGNVQSLVVTTMTTTYDATPLTTAPAGIAAIATGTYALPISAPSAIQNSCLSDTQQSSAWSCQIPEMAYEIVVTSVPGNTDPLRSNEIDLNINNNNVNNFYAYGAKPPVLTSAQIMSLVTDNNEVARGPAWFFELPYNKVVVVQQDSLSGAGSIHTKRDHTLSVVDFTRKQVAQPGDNPWFCYWNGTMLEAFIYANQTSSAGRTTQISSSSDATPTSSGYSQASATPTTSSSGEPEWLPAYPLLLKLEERRIQGAQSIAPYCVQQHIDSSGNATPLINSTNQAVTIWLNETQSSTVANDLTAKRSYDFSIDSRALDERQEAEADCGCVWLWT